MGWGTSYFKAIKSQFATNITKVGINDKNYKKNTFF